MIACSFLTVTTSLLWVLFQTLDLLLLCACVPLCSLRRGLRQCLARSWSNSGSGRALRLVHAGGGSGFGGARVEGTVVICGASFGGLAALRHLEDSGFRIILIDQRTFFEYTPGILRLFCEPECFNSLAKPLPSGRHQFVLGSVVSVQKNHINVAIPGGGVQQVSFDYLVLGLGADYRQPITATPRESLLAARRATWQASSVRLRGASSVLVLGGGAVGTELAAEIACFYPEKRITIVDAQPHLVPLFLGQTVEYVEQWFRSRGVELLLGEMLDNFDETGCVTKSGRTIKADSVFVCFGMKCNSQPVHSGDFCEEVNSRGAVQVNEFFQVRGAENVFAIGDMMVHPSLEIKQAYYAEANGEAVAMNILRMDAGMPTSSWVRYPVDICGNSSMPLVYVVSLGRYDGSLGFNKLVINGVCAALVKWIIEWTKVKQMQGRPIGILIWKIGDWITFFLSRTLIKPADRV